MGLLDFFNKGGNANPQSDNTNPPAVPDFAGIQQSYTNQSLANVSYPMANSNPYAATNAVAPQVSPAIQDLSTQFNPVPPPMAISPSPGVSTMPQVNQSMQTPQVEPMPVAMPQALIQPELPAGEYVDPSKHPVIPSVIPDQGHTETMPEGIKVTTFESNGAVPYNPQPQEPVTQVEQSQDVTQEHAQETPSEQSQVVHSEPLTTGFMPITNSLDQTQPDENPVKDIMDMPQNSIPVQNQMPVSETVPELNSTEVANTSSVPEVNLTPMVNEQPQPGLDTTPGMPELPTEGVIPVVPVIVQPEPVIDINNIGLEIGVGLEGANGTDVTPSTELPQTLPEVAEVAELIMETEPKIETTPVIEPQENVTTEIAMPEAQVESPAEAALNIGLQTKESLSEKEPTVQNTPFEMSYFKTVGFIGLNVHQTNIKVVEKISELSKKLSEHAEVFILDSAKGYAKSIYDNAKEKQIELMGMFLKPFHSGYSDEADLGDYDDFTVMMFSNSGDKIKNIIKESELLIMPEVTGLNNISTLFDIWSTNSMYPGQNKPLLLIGKGWTNILTQLKSLFKLSEADLAFVTICQTTEEALAKITELDKEFINKEVKQQRKVIDLREEDDEEGLFV